MSLKDISIFSSGGHFVQRSRISGFALPIPIVAKCEEIINLAQKILLWRHLLAKEKSLVIFCLAWERHFRPLHRSPQTRKKIKCHFQAHFPSSIV